MDKTGGKSQQVRQGPDPSAQLTEPTAFDVHLFARGVSGGLLYLGFHKDGVQHFTSGTAQPGETLRSAIDRTLQADFDIGEWRFLQDIEPSGQDAGQRQMGAYVLVPYFHVAG